jgi:hypothetical protein
VSTAPPPARGERSGPRPGSSPGGDVTGDAAPSDRLGRGRRVIRDHPYAALVAACLAGGALSLLVLPAGVGSDAWAWLVWGRELIGLELDPTNGPSWKPLPVVLTTPLALLGDAAPLAWSVVARAGALLAVAFCFRLGARIGGPVAAGLAALALLTTDLVDYAASADSEPLAAALLLWALERHLDGRRAQALVLLALAALGRPEAWVLLALYAGLLAVREPRLRLPAAAALVLPPALWLGPPWLATGDALSAGTRANRVTEASLATADVPALAVVVRTAELAPLPVLAAALVAAAAALLVATGRRSFAGLGPGEPSRATLVLAGGAAVWVALVAALTQAGFTGNERYLFPAVAAVCVLGGVGAAVIVRAVGGGRRGAAGGTSTARGSAVDGAPPGGAVLGPSRTRTAAAVLVLLLLAAPFGLARARDVAGFRAEAAERALTIAGLESAVARAGGPARVLDCGGPAVTRPGTQGTLAWELDVPLSAVARSWPPDPRLELDPPSVVFSRAERRFDLLRREGMLAPGLEPAPLTIRAGRWQAFLVLDPGGAAPAACRARAPAA